MSMAPLAETITMAGIVFLNLIPLYIYLDPSDIFRGNTYELNDSLSKSSSLFARVRDELRAKSLLTDSIFDDVASTNDTLYEKCSKIVDQLYKRIKGTRNTSEKVQILNHICDILVHQEDPAIKKIGEKMKITN